jgi:hypothetical protein
VGGFDVFFHEADFGAFCFYEQQGAGWIGWVLFVRAADGVAGEGPGYRRMIPGGPFATRNDLNAAALPFVQEAVRTGTTGLH